MTPAMHPSPADARLLDTARRYATTPRQIDARLARVIEDVDGSWVGLATITVATLGGLGACAVAVFAFGGKVSWAAFGGVCGGAVVATAVALLFDRRSFGRAKAQCEISLRDGPLVIAHVVQANHELYTPGDDTLPALFVFSRSPGRAWDLAYGRWLAARVQALKGAPNPGGDASGAWTAVNDDHSSPSLHLPPGFAGDGDAHLYSCFIDQSLLPERCLGPERAFVAIHCAPRELFMVF